MKIDRVEKITRLNQWLEIIHGNPESISWPKGYTKKEAFSLYLVFKNQPERASGMDNRDVVCGAPTTPTKGSEPTGN